jgi:hypothetical protein
VDTDTSKDIDVSLIVRLLKGGVIVESSASDDGITVKLLTEHVVMTGDGEDFYAALKKALEAEDPTIKPQA